MAERSVPILPRGPVLGFTIHHCLSFLMGGHSRCGAHSTLSIFPRDILRSILTSLDGIWYVASNYFDIPASAKTIISEKDLDENESSEDDDEVLVWEDCCENCDDLETVMLVVKNGVTRWQRSDHCTEPWLFPLGIDCRTFWPLSSSSIRIPDQSFDNFTVNWSMNKYWCADDAHGIAETGMVVRILTVSIPYDVRKSKYDHNFINDKTQPYDCEASHISHDRTPDYQTIFQLCIDPLLVNDKNVTHRSPISRVDEVEFDCYDETTDVPSKELFDIKYIRCIFQDEVMIGRIKLEGRFSRQGHMPQQHCTPRTGFQFLSADPHSNVMLELMNYIPRSISTLYITALTRFADL